MRAVILGISSDIGREIAERLLRDGWEVAGTYRTYHAWHTGDDTAPRAHIVPCDLGDRAQIEQAAHWLGSPWDLLVVAVGTYEPLGPFMQCDADDWEMNIQVNALGPLRFLRLMYPSRKFGASVCFFAGPNPNRANPSYTAYMAGKAVLHKACEDIQAENADMKFFILGPGLTRTKMLDQTIKAGEKAFWYPRVKAFLESGEQGSEFEDIYKMMRVCMDVEWAKGRNIHIKDNWAGIKGLDNDTFKLRRHEGRTSNRTVPQR